MGRHVAGGRQARDIAGEKQQGVFCRQSIRRCFYRDGGK